MDTPAVKYGRMMQQEGIPFNYYFNVVFPRLIRPLINLDIFGFLADPLAGFNPLDWFFDFILSYVYINQYWAQYTSNENLPEVTFTE